MKARTRKLLSLLLTLCMVIGLLPGMALTASAAEAALTPATWVSVNGGVTLDSSKPYLVNGRAAASGTLGSDGCTAKFENGTLTLKGYNGGRISSQGSSTARISLTVVVDGANTITSTGGSGITCMYGDLTVKGATANKDTDALAVTSVNACVEAYQGSMTIQNLKELNAASTATNNTAISVMLGDALTISDIGTMKVSIPNIGGGYTAVSNRDGSVSITNVTDLEVYSGGNGIRAAGSSASPDALSITGCETVMLYGGSASSAIEGYQSGVTVNADTVVAIGGRQAVSSSGGDISIVAGNTLYLDGGSSAVYSDSNGTVMVKKGGTPVEDLSGKTVAPAGNGSTGKTPVTLTISETTLTYTGQPASLTVTAATTGETVTGLTYLYAWYDSNQKILGGTAPVDAGSYYVTVHGYNDTYKGSLEKQAITISKIAAPAEYAKTVNANITNGNNLITLPEIPNGMGFGTPVRCDEAGNVWSASDGVTLTPTLSGNLLSVQASGMTADKYYVQVPVNAGSKSNYNGYNIILTLTNLTNKAIFDRCDGSEPALVDVSSDDYTLPDTELYSTEGTSTHPKGAWEAAIGDAKMYGYEFAGWYTAPNGWGTQVSDKNGKNPANSEQNATFTAGTTYYAKWVWTIGSVGAELIDNDYYNVYHIYGVLSTPRTVYTTCLDFTKNAPSDGDGYKWANNTLTLDGVHIQALDSVCGIILPAGSKIEVVSLKNNSYSSFYKHRENNAGPDEPTTDYAGYSKASNIISCGSVDATADVFCLGDLTILSDATNAETGEEVGLGNWLNAKQGGIRTAADGTLTVKNANIDTTRLHADGAITIYDSLIFATNFSSTFTGDRYVRSYNGSVTIQDGWVFTEWLQAATNLSISRKESRIRASFGASAGEKITISNSGYKHPSGSTYNFALDFGDGENALWGLYAKNIEILGSLLNSSAIMTEGTLTVSGGSEVNAHGSGMALPICIYGGGSISNSTVNVTEVDSGSVGIYSTGPLTINRSTVTVTKANAATPTAAILVIAPKTGTGLVLNSSAITVPSGGTVEKMVPTEINDDKTAVWFIVESNRTSIANEVTIVPVSAPSSGGSSTSSGGSSTSSVSNVTLSSSENGSVSVSPKNAATGSTVTVTVKPDAGFVLDKLTVTDGSGNVLTLTDKGNGQYAFTMPAGKVKVNAEFKQETTAPADESFEEKTPVSDPSSGGSSTSSVSNVTLSSSENGSVSVSPKNAATGSTVTVTVKPDAGFVLDKLTVTDGSGNVLTLTDKGNGQYAFTMPAGKVKVNAEFKQETTAPADESFEEMTTMFNADQLSGLMAGGILGIFLGGMFVLQIALEILQIIGGWKVFNKFGEPGWKAIIPFYNFYVEYKYTWKPMMALPVFILGIGGGIAMQCVAEGSALQMIFSLAFLVGWILSLVGFHKLSKAFGKGIGFTIGMVLLPGIFRIILGFGKAQYVGNSSVTEQK